MKNNLLKNKSNSLNIETKNNLLKNKFNSLDIEMLYLLLEQYQWEETNLLENNSDKIIILSKVLKKKKAINKRKTILKSLMT